MEPLSVFLVFVAILILIALVVLIVSVTRLNKSFGGETTWSPELDQAVRQIEAKLDELDRIQRDLADLAQTTATERGVSSQRYNDLVKRINDSDERTAGVRREVTQQLGTNRQELDQRLSKMTERVETQLTEIRGDTNKQLDRMRETVDEKLQETLNKRITQSFELVNERLQQVDQGLGEMKNLASDVGGLKRVLSGVKTRGILGEVQLGAILEEILAPSQYDTNVATVPGSSERVEFAVRLPGEDGETVYLPIDAKFPGDTYERLRDAQESGDQAAVDEAWKNLEKRLCSEAKDIHDKYLAPPDTTTFGILFLPFEGLYAEVAGRAGLIERLQRNYQVNIAGPSTMAALLNSLEMGFQTVAIQKRASEIQKVLEAVKTEFGKYRTTLRKAQKQLGTVSRTVDDLVGTRSRQMERKLKSITELDDPAEAARILEINEVPADELDDVDDGLAGDAR